MQVIQNRSAAGGRLPLSMKAGYAIGQMSDSISFNLFYFFYLYFLTDFAGIPGGTAGVISLIAIIWDAITDPIVGNISDGLRTKWGRRRPMMIGIMFPYAISIYFLFNNVGLLAGAKVAYFIIVTILFWTCYKLFVIPYFALGAEITDDFDERTSVRTWASVFMYLAVLIASAAPPVILEFTASRGGSDDNAWHSVAILFAILVMAAIFICWKLTKGGENVVMGAEVEKNAMIGAEAGERRMKSEKLPSEDVNCDKPNKELPQKANFFVNFGEVVKLKPARTLMITVLLGSMVSSLSSSGSVYLMSNVLFYNGSLQSMVYTVMSVASILWLPVIGIAAQKFDKKAVYTFSLLFVSMLSVGFYFIGFATIVHMVVFIIFFQVGMSAYWTLYYSMMYDISELDEFKTGRRREGMISAVMSFSQKLGAAISMWLIGFVLELGGYDGLAETQSDSAIQAILSINTWIPGICCLAAAMVALAYPLTRKRFELLMAALVLKREGKEYSTDGFEKLL